MFVLVRIINSRTEKIIEKITAIKIFRKKLPTACAETISLPIK